MRASRRVVAQPRPTECRAICQRIEHEHAKKEQRPSRFKQVTIGGLRSQSGDRECRGASGFADSIARCRRDPRFAHTYSRAVSNVQRYGSHPKGVDGCRTDQPGIEDARQIRSLIGRQLIQLESPGHQCTRRGVAKETCDRALETIRRRKSWRSARIFVAVWALAGMDRGLNLNRHEDRLNGKQDLTGLREHLGLAAAIKDHNIGLLRSLSEAIEDYAGTHAKELGSSRPSMRAKAVSFARPISPLCPMRRLKMSTSTCNWLATPVQVELNDTRPRHSDIVPLPLGRESHCRPMQLEPLPTARTHTKVWAPARPVWLPERTLASLPRLGSVPQS